MTTPEDALRTLLEGSEYGDLASPRPWRAGDDDRPKPRYLLDALGEPIGEMAGPSADTDANLIVAAVNALPALLDRLAAVEAAPPLDARALSRIREAAAVRAAEAAPLDVAPHPVITTTSQEAGS